MKLFNFLKKVFSKQGDRVLLEKIIKEHGITEEISLQNLQLVTDKDVIGYFNYDDAIKKVAYFETNKKEARVEYGLSEHDDFHYTTTKDGGFLIYIDRNIR